jgi:hypothetical protein
MPQTSERAATIGVFVVFSFFGVVALLCAGLGGRSGTTVNSAPEPTLYEKVAVIEAKSASGMRDPQMVSGVKARLQRLSRKFPESEEQIAAMTLKTQELLKEKGIQRSITEIMDNLDYAVPSNALGVTYAEAAAAFVTLDEKRN